MCDLQMHRGNIGIISKNRLHRNKNCTFFVTRDQLLGIIHANKHFTIKGNLHLKKVS